MKPTRRARRKAPRAGIAAMVGRLESRQMLASTTIDLAALTAAEGTILFGADEGDTSGYAVSNAGDVNGDGFDDLAIGAFNADAAGNAKPLAGESYVVFGGPALPATIDLANLRTAGITIFGPDAGGSSGFAISTAGDVNGDGFDDLLIGDLPRNPSVGPKPSAGESHVVFGGAALPSTIDLANLGAAGITIVGADVGDFSGRSVSRAGDLNGDGFDDLVIGAIYASAGGNAKSRAGESYVIFGGTALPSTIDLANPGTAGITILGADAGDFAGVSISTAGDVNGDGFDDLLIGTYPNNNPFNPNPRAGKSYVVFGGPALPTVIDLANVGTAGITILGAETGDASGVEVSIAGDVNGDGFDDLLIGAPLADAAGNAKSDAGESYIVFGGTALPAVINLANLGAAGVTIYGADEDDESGLYVSGVGDVNGDGFDDVSIGTESADAAGNAKFDAGESYLIFGGPALPATLDLADLDTAGITYLGADEADNSGSVSGAGDVNGDGFDDLLIGARYADAANNAKISAGESYLIYGGDFTDAVTHPGTNAAETLTGTAGADVIVGGRGHDTLVGTGGADVLIGGQGNDLLAVSDPNFARLVGGTGIDSVRLDGSDLTLDLTTLADNRLLGIERIDLTGTGDNRLKLSVRDVLNLSDETNTLIVSGNSGDGVRLDGGWTRGANETLGDGEYRVYTQGAATLKVATAVSLITPATIDLAALKPTEGTIILGADSGDRSGVLISTAGDVNGDGFDDLLIGAPYADAAGNAKPTAGESYVVFGGPSLPATIDLANLGTAGITIFGADEGDFSSFVSPAGDMNGDGFDDLLIGAPFADALGNAKPQAGESYVVFGGAALPTTIDLANLGTAGITIFGSDDGDTSGFVGPAGDVNGDGFDDLLIGAPYAAAAGNTKASAGETYVIFGGATLPATIDLDNLGPAGLTIFGAEEQDDSGRWVSNAGDVNGDGFDDLLISALQGDAADNAKEDAGETYVIFGGPALPAVIDLANLGTAGITIFGAEEGDSSGSVSAAGDVNGDGFDDLIIGAGSASGADYEKSEAGESYIVFGGAALPATIDLANLGTAGVTIYGADEDDESGLFVSGVGDVNGDGFDDVSIGAIRASAAGNAKPQAGESYLIFGGPALPATLDLANLDAAGITIFGADAGDQSGLVSAAGDVNGDGFDDLLIGTLYASVRNAPKIFAGESYIIYGGDFTEAVTHRGTSAAETLTGTAGADAIVGGRGNDTLVGTGGADVLIGGQGDDVLTISDLNFERLVGGNGFDTVRLDGSGIGFNFVSLADNRLQGIEQLDITGTGDNVVSLTTRDVLNLSDETNTLVIRRNAGDLVFLSGGSWTPQSDDIIGSERFSVYTSGAATVKVLDSRPLLTTPGAITYQENDAAKAIAPGIVLIDSDSATLASATVTLTNFVAGQDELAFLNDGATMGNITANVNNGVLTLTSAGATATRAEWQAALRAVTYFNNSNNPDTTTRTVTFVVNDGQFNSAALASTVTVQSVNDTPLLGGVTVGQSVNDNSSIQPLAALTISDPETQSLFAKVTILNGVFRGDFTEASALGWTRTVTGNNIIYSRFYAQAENNGAAAQAAIQSLVFQPRSNVLKPNRTELTDIAVFVSDGIANATATTRLTTVSANDAPTIGNASNTVAVNDDATVNPFATLTVTDIDMQEMLASVTILNGVNRGDFTNASSAGWTTRVITGNNITYKKYFHPAANIGATVQAAFRALTFQPRTNAIKPGTTELTDFQVTVSDGVAPAIANSTTRVTTTSVNNAPVIGGAVADQTMNSNSAKAVFSTLTVTDPDMQDSLVRVTIKDGIHRGDFPTAKALGWSRAVIGSDIVFSRYFSPQPNIGGTVQAAIRVLVFQPRTNITVGTQETTIFTVYVKDGLTESTDSTTSVTTTGVAARATAPAISAVPVILSQDIETIVVRDTTPAAKKSLTRLFDKKR